MKTSLIITILTFISSGCVSVSLSPKIKKASDLQFNAPAGNFNSIKSPGADEAWQDQKLGNSISFMSTCNDPADPSIEAIQSDTLSSLDSAKILKTEKGFFDGRESLKTQAEGSVDGVATKIEVLTFKKNSCTYSVNYVAVTKNFDQDLEAFHKFLGTFKAP